MRKQQLNVGYDWTRRNFLLTASAAAACGGSTSLSLSTETLAKPVANTKKISGFRPDLNGLMSVRHQWELKMHQKAALFREKEEALQHSTVIAPIGRVAPYPLPFRTTQRVQHRVVTRW